LPGADAEARPEMTSFSGTQSLPWTMARARSMGSLSKGSVLDKALKARHKTDFEILVDVLVSAVRDERPVDIRHFKQPYNAHRHVVDDMYLNPDRRRKKVLQVLQTYPLADIYDLATVSPEYWTRISRDLGGLSHDNAMKHALEHVQQVLTPTDRAALWAAAGPRMRVADHYKQTHFVPNSDLPLDRLKVGARYGYRREDYENGPPNVPGLEWS